MTTRASASTESTASLTDLDLTAARIRRAARRTMGPAINGESARDDAAIVHQIIACVRQAYATPYAEWGGDESDTIETILRTVAGVWSRGDSEWIMEQLIYAERLLGRDDLYKGYLHVCGHVENEDYSWVFEDDPPSADPSLAGVTFEEEVVLEDNDDGDDAHRQRTRRRHPHLQLVTKPEVISADDLDRMFLQLMGGFEQPSGNDRPRRRRPGLPLVTDPELTSADDMERRFLALMEDSS